MNFLPTEQLESPDWLRSLRWVALVGMAASIAGAAFFGAELPEYFLFGLLGALAVLNLFWPKLERFVGTPRTFIFLQLVVDVFVLTAVLWWSGGLVNPFVSFYLFHVCIAGLLLDFWLTAGISALTIFSILALTKAPGLIFRGEEILLAHSRIWIGIPIGLVLLICVTTAFVFSFMGRLRRAQTELRRRGRMEALGTLVGGLGHELGTPLNSILVLAKDLEENPSVRENSAFATMRVQAERCGRLVKLLLGWNAGSAVRVDWIPLQTEPFLTEIFYSVFGEDRSNDFELSVEHGLHTITAPEVHLRQSLMNVFRNAEQAMRGRQDSWLAVRCYRDDTTAGLCINVRDNGPGFSPEARERAFDPFFTTKGVDEGTGLGLYISYYLLEQIGGTIQIEGIPQGASLVIKIPERGHDA